jgi:hypothetical protein
MSYNNAEFNYFPFGFQQEYKTQQFPRGEHPIYHLEVGQTYISKGTRDYRACFNRTTYLKSRGVEIQCHKGIFTRIK